MSTQEATQKRRYERLRMFDEQLARTAEGGSYISERALEIRNSLARKAGLPETGFNDYGQATV